MPSPVIASRRKAAWQSRCMITGLLCRLRRTAIRRTPRNDTLALVCSIAYAAVYKWRTRQVGKAAHKRYQHWRVFVEVAGKASHRWWLWVICTAETCSYIIDPSRSSRVPRDHLGDHAQGIISADRFVRRTADRPPTRTTTTPAVRRVGPHRHRARSVHEQIQLLFLDPILHLAARAIDLLMHARGIVCLGRQRRHHKARIATFRQPCGLADHPPRPAPALVRLVREKSL